MNFVIAQRALPWQSIYGPIFCHLADPILTCRPGVPKRLEDRNTDFMRINGNDFSTLFTTLVIRFGPVSSEFMTLECIQQASLTTGVSLTTFVKWRLAFLDTSLISKPVCFTAVR